MMMLKHLGALLLLAASSVSASTSHHGSTSTTGHHHASRAQNIVQYESANEEEKELLNITLQHGYPRIDFNSNPAIGDKLVFKYNFTGSIEGDNFLEPQIYAADCVTHGSPWALTVSSTSTHDNILTLTIDVVDDFVDPSSYYSKDEEHDSASIRFCMRVDFMESPEKIARLRSLSFHETVVNVDVDLKGDKNFELIAIDAERINAASEEENSQHANVDFSVVAYPCDGDSMNGLAVAPVYENGDTIQLCVRIDDRDAPVNFHDDALITIEDIVSMNVTQLGDNPARPVHAVHHYKSSEHTHKKCGTAYGGGCIVKHKILIRFFEHEEPGYTQVTGLVDIGIGDATTRRLLRVPLASSSHHDRSLASTTSHHPERMEKKLQSKFTAGPLKLAASDVTATSRGGIDGESISDRVHEFGEAFVDRMNLSDGPAGIVLFTAAVLCVVATIMCFCLSMCRRWTDRYDDPEWRQARIMLHDKFEDEDPDDLKAHQSTRAMFAKAANRQTSTRTVGTTSSRTLVDLSVGMDEDIMPGRCHE